MSTIGCEIKNISGITCDGRVGLSPKGSGLIKNSFKFHSVDEGYSFSLCFG